MTLVVAIISGVFWGYQKTLIFCLSSIIILSILSSLPVFMLVFGFLVIPLSISYLRKQSLLELPVLGAIPIIVLPLILFEAMFIITERAFSVGVLQTALFFIVMNSIVAIFLYMYILNKIKKQRLGIIK